MARSREFDPQQRLANLPQPTYPDELPVVARRDWEARYPDSAWERFKDSVRHGWERLTRASGARARSADRAGRHPAA